MNNKGKCKECSKLIGRSKNGVCRRCYYNSLAGKHHHLYKSGKYSKVTERKRCPTCGLFVSCNATYCKKCFNKGELNPNFGKETPKFIKEKIRKSYSNSKSKHHLYLKENSSDTISIPHGKHTTLHRKAYQFLYEMYGEEGIDMYIQWFKDRYGIEFEKETDEDEEENIEGNKQEE